MAEAEGRHFLAVAHQQEVADQHRMVPRLAADRRDLPQLGELVGGRRHQRQLALLAKDQQQILIRQEHQLTVAVAAALPSALAVGHVDAGEQAAVKPVGVAFVHDEVVEVRLQSVRRPATRRRPSAVAVGNGEAVQSGDVAGGDQEIAIGGHGRLHDRRGHAARGHGDVPQLRAVRGRHAGRALGVEQDRSAARREG